MNSKQWQQIAAWGGLAILIFVGVVYYLNSGYSRLGESGSDIAVSLVSACNLKNVQRIESLSKEFQIAQSEGRLEAGEVRWLSKALDYASQGDWEEAQELARELLKEQVVPNRSLPELE